MSEDGQTVAEVGDLVRLHGNGTLALAPFAAAAYRPDVHAATYRCGASNAAGSLLSRDVKLRAGTFIMTSFQTPFTRSD